MVGALLSSKLAALWLCDLCVHLCQYVKGAEESVSYWYP